MNQRIQKIIAASGLASRRKAEDLIKQGKVTINGETATLGMQAGPSDVIVAEGKRIRSEVKTVVYAVNKPAGVVCSRTRQASEKIITDLVPASPAVYPIGRLDKDSGGLILLTNDGELAQRLTHPSFEHKKHYKVVGKWKDEEGDTAQVERKLRSGVKLGDGKAKVDKVTATPAKDGLVIIELTIHEGRHHLVRRMCAAVGIEVKSLVRTGIGALSLASIPQGNFRPLTKQDLDRL